MSGGPSQPKVVDEIWSDERVRSFLDLRPYDHCDPDYHVLRKAYEHMTAADFTRFIGEFCRAGRDINALGPEGHTFLQRVRGHGRSQDYAMALTAAGAK